MGPAIWVAVQGEPYNLLQQALREHRDATADPFLDPEFLRSYLPGG